MSNIRDNRLRRRLQEAMHHERGMMEAKPLTDDDLDRMEAHAKDRFMDTAFQTVMSLLREVRRLKRERADDAQPYEMEDDYEGEHV